jgi:hypothetical protein
VDGDGDGTCDGRDDCPNDPDKVNPGLCGCGSPDVDSDGDGWLDCYDNCPNDPNQFQEDANGDGVGDACEPAAAPAPFGCGAVGLPILPMMAVSLGWAKRRERRRR